MKEHIFTLTMEQAKDLKIGRRIQTYHKGGNKVYIRFPIEEVEGGVRAKERDAPYLDDGNFHKKKKRIRYVLMSEGDWKVCKRTGKVKDRSYKAYIERWWRDPKNYGFANEGL